MRNAGAVRSSVGVWKTTGERCTTRQADPTTGPELLDGLRAEAQILRLLSDVKGVPRLLEFDMLSRLLVVSAPPGLPLPEAVEAPGTDLAQAMRIVLGLLQVLEDLHAVGVVHGNVQPAHVLLEPSTGRVWLVDFSEAVAQRRFAVTFGQSGALAVKARPYSAPEQTGRIGTGIDYRADYYGLGATLYWLVTGVPPFAEIDPLTQLHALLTRQPAPPENLNPRLPHCCARVIDKLLAKRPEDRYQSAAGLRLDLEHALSVAEGRRTDGPFTAGTSDHRTQPAPPSELIERSAEVSQILTALGSTAAERRVVWVHGPSGSGKSALVRALQPQLAQRHALLVAGKYDQHSQHRPCSALVDALAQLAESWLAAPEIALAVTRQMLRAAVGSHVDLLVRLVPMFAPLLQLEPGLPLTAPEADEPVDVTSVAPRTAMALAAVFRTVRRLGAPLVLFLDDLQWADPDSLELMRRIASEESHGAVLLVGAYRDAAPGQVPALRRALADIEGAGCRVVSIALGGLAPDATAQVVADVLDAVPQEVEGLAAVLHQRTGGNAFHVLQHLQRMFDAGHLSRAGGRWRWDVAALTALPGTDDLIAGLAQQLHALPADSRELVALCACMGGRIDEALLCRTLGIDRQMLDDRLLPLLQQGLLLMSRPSPLSVPSALVPGTRQLHFCHDRVQQVALALVDEAQRQAWHLALAHALVEAYAPQDVPHGLLFAAAHHYAAGMSRLDRPRHGPRVLRILLRAAEIACTRAAFANALSFRHAAAQLETGADAGLRLRLGVVTHAALYSLGRFEEADAVFAQSITHADGHLEQAAQLLSLQAMSLNSRLRQAESLSMLWRHLRQLGFEVPLDHQWEQAAQAEMDRLQQSPEMLDAARIEALPLSCDVRIRTIAALLQAAGIASKSSSKPVFYWSMLRGVRLALEHGRTDRFPFVLVLAATVFLSRGASRSVVGQLSRAALRLVEEPGAGWQRHRVRLAAATCVLHWEEPVEQSADLAHADYTEAFEQGDLECASYGFMATLPAVVDCASHLDEVRAVLDNALVMAARTRSEAAREVYLVFDDLLSALTGNERSERAGASGAAPRQLADPGSAQGWASSYGYVYQALAATLACDWTLALSLCRRSEAMMGLIESLYVHSVQRVLWALSLAVALRRPGADRDALRAELAPLQDWLVACASHAQANFTHLNTLLDALLAWADGQWHPAARRFDAAIDGAAVARRCWHQALACELAAEFHDDAGTPRAAAYYRESAARAYAAWGASAKAPKGMAEGGMAPPLLPLPPPPEPPRSLEVDVVLSATEALARGREPQEVQRILFGLVRRYAAADRGVLLWREGTAWQSVASFDARHDWLPAGEPGQAPGVPTALMRYLTATAAPVQVSAVQDKPAFSRDEELRRRGVKSLLGLPIFSGGEHRGVLYLENSQAPIQLANFQIDTLKVVGQQFAAAFENAHVNANLERLVATRTEALHREIAERSRAEQAADAASRAKSDFLATMSHEIRTPMNAVIGMSALALQTPLDARQRNFIGKAHQSAVLLLGIINDVLDLSKIEAGRLELEKVPFDLRDGLANLANVVGLAAEAKGLALLFDLPPDLPTLLCGDPLRLSQVLLNLCNNAVKFTDHGEVTVHIRHACADDGTLALKVAVTDTGPGMDELAQQRLFAPFSQADASVSRTHGGTGLGLSICARLVALMGGSIGVESRPGAGSRFHFEISLSRQELDGAPVMRVLDGARVLVADAHAGTRALLSTGLAALGARPETVADLQAAADAVAAAAGQQSPYALMLLDAGLVQSPDGQALQYALQRMAGAPPLLLMASPYRAAGLTARPVAHGQAADIVLEKPFTPWSLQEACDAALRQASGPPGLLQAGPAPMATDASALRGARILLVDDNDINLEVAAEMMASFDVLLFTASDGEAALEFLSRNVVDGVLMDCLMPQMDGYEAARRIRAQPAMAGMPVIAMTASVMPEEVRRATDAGMDAHLTKPIQLDSLRDTLLHWIGPRAADRLRPGRAGDGGR